MFKDKLREEQMIWRMLNDHQIEILDQEAEKISQLLTQMFYAVDLKPKLIEILINQYFYYDEQKHVFFEQAGWLLEEVTARAIDEKKQEEHYQVFLQSLYF